jgi:fumarate reductase flavoprotein subunit
MKLECREAKNFPAFHREQKKEDIMTETNLTRRKFMLMSSAAIAAPLLMNAAGAVAAEKKETYDIKKKLEYDLVIIGGGMSGLFAAARAAELGVKKIGLFEKGDHFGGNGRMCRTFFSSDFADYGNYNSDENQIKLYRRAMKYLHQTGNPEVIQRYVFATKRVAKWLEDRKVNEKWMILVPPPGGPFDTQGCSRNVDNRKEYAALGSLICDVLIAEIKSNPGVETHLKAPGVKLLTDKQGDVTGAVVKLGGEYAEVSGKKLVLACGGAGGSFESLCRWLPKYMAPGDYINMGSVRTCTADGIGMAEALGAEVGKDMNMHMLGPGYAGSRGSALGQITDDPRIMIVNKEGRRFIDEAIVEGIDENNKPLTLIPTNRAPGKVTYTLLGAGSFGAIWKEKGDGTPVSEIPAKYADDIKKGALCIAEDLDKAAKFIGCDAKTLKDSVDRYEASCKAGYDSHLLKTKEKLLSLGGAPYYALWGVRSMDSTQGGITINREFEAVTPDGKAIGGMYVTGDHATGFVTSDYYGPGGAGFTWAMTSGFIAGEDAAKFIKKTEG